MDLLAVAALLFAFAFTFTNGFQDAAAIAATFIASRSATPRQGIMLVAGMNVMGAILGGTAVAFTISELIEVTEPSQTLVVLLVALATASAWNLATWSRGLPSSSTHALVGGLIGAAVAGTGIGSVNWGVAALIGPTPELDGVMKVLVVLVVSVVIGLGGGFAVQRGLAMLLRNSRRRAARRRIVASNWAAALGMAFFNGANDAQKQLGIIALVLFAAGQTATLEVPLWARALTALLLGLGTLSGGWRVMNTLGHRIFRIAPVHSLVSGLLGIHDCGIDPRRRPSLLVPHHHGLCDRRGRRREPPAAELERRQRGRDRHAHHDPGHGRAGRARGAPRRSIRGDVK